MISSSQDLQRIQVLLPLSTDRTFDYWVPSSLTVAKGMLVRVPFRTTFCIGAVWRDQGLPPLPEKLALKLKEIIEPVAGICLPSVHLDFLKWVADYTLAPLGSVLKMTLSVPKVFERGLSQRRRVTRLGSQEKFEEQSSSPVFSLSSSCSEFPSPDPGHHQVTFNPDQQQAVEYLKHQAPKGHFSVTLLEGVTGSGKTEVYFEAISEALRKKLQTLVLLPEIALTPQMIDRFKRRFGALPALWHSGLSPAVRRETWKQVQQNQVSVVIGARSALFLPYSRLGLIIVDEEHEAAYKQEEGVLYQGRDMAVVRAHLGQIPCILVSATPSIETLVNCQKKRYGHVILGSRYGEAHLPKIDCIHLKSESGGRPSCGPSSRSSQEPGISSLPSSEAVYPLRYWISRPLAEAIQDTLDQGDQVMLFLNRRGYAPLTLCQKCGFRLQCPDCSVWLVEHRRSGKLLCHYCGYSQDKPLQCLHCSEPNTLIAWGPGVERVEEEVRSRFPKAIPLIMASDHVSSGEGMKNALQSISDRKVNLIIGTQMMAKGHHFPFLTLVGVIDADLGLAGGDLRAGERTFQLLHQVAGRCGRGAKPGRVFLQTFYPDHPVIQALTQGQGQSFLIQELALREELTMPPYGRLASLILSGLKGDQVEQTARRIVQAAPIFDGVEILGPAPAPLAMIRRRYRWRILIKSTRSVNIQKVVKEWLGAFNLPSQIRLAIDIDPYSFL